MLAAIGGPALAQQAAGGGQAQTGASDDLLGEVVVTATRQADTVNRVPLSIAAVTQKSLDQQGIKVATDLQRIVPSLTVTNQVGGVANFAIRGIVATTGAATTGVYLDDTALTKRSNSGVSQNNGAPLPVLFDLERVEVLKGPQGTLYGGSSQGGTIRVITPSPSLTTYSGVGKLEYSDVKNGSESYEYGVAAGGPILRNKLGFRASAFVRHTGGFIDVLNAYNAGALVKRDANQTDDRVLRVAVTAAPTERARVTLAGYTSRSEYTGGPSTSTVLYGPNGQPAAAGQTYTTPTTYVCRVRPATPTSGPFTPQTNTTGLDPCPRTGASAIPPGPNQTYVRPAATYGPFDYLQQGDVSITPYDNLINGGRTLFDTASVTLDYQFDKMSVKSITSYVRDKTIGDSPESQDPGRVQTTLQNPGRTSFPLFSLYPNYAGRFVSSNRRNAIEQELRFSSPGDQRPFNWVAGLFFSNSRTHIVYKIVGEYSASTQALYGVNQQTRYGLPADPCNCVSTLDAHLADTELAAFGEANYWVTQKLKLTAGIRQSRVSLNYSQLNGGILASRPLSDPYSLATGASTDSPVTPKVGTQYQLTDDNMLYANAAKGFRAGGVNNQLNPNTCAVGLALFGLTVNDIPKDYGPDTVWSYEAGGKFRLLDRKLQLNLAAFRIDWTNIQVSIAAQGCGQNWSQNGGSARSQGVDLQAQYRPIQPLTLTVAAGYTDAKYLAPVTGPTPLTGSPAIAINKGDGFGIPKWQVNFTAQYDFEVMSHNLYVRGDYQYQGPYLQGVSFGAANFNPFTRQVKAQDLFNLRAGVAFDRFDVNVFANNVTNSRDKIGNAGNGIGACTAAGGASCTAYGTFQPFVAQQFQRPRSIGVQANYRF
jgi:outer membrane receptor protein involved in Fe transport